MKDKLELQANRIEALLMLHKVPARVTGGSVTPRWIRFNVLPAMGARISKIRNMNEEFAAALNVPSCRVSRRGAAIAVEIPRDDPRPVRLLPLFHQLVGDQEPIPPITAILGLGEDGTPLLIRLPSPDVAHILVAGTTGSGKTVLLQTMILSLAMINPPSALALVLIDPKAHALTPFDRLPHLPRPVVCDASDAIQVLGGLVRLMERRTLPAQAGGRPHVVVFVDEFADLLMVGGDPVRRALTRLTQRGRQAGIHVVAATQKPTAAILGPLVKANFPVRLVGRVTSAEDARTATGWSGTGAERLLGRGDFLAVAEGRVSRFQAAHVSLAEIEETVAGLGVRVPGSFGPRHIGVDQLSPVCLRPGRQEHQALAIPLDPPPPEPEPDLVLAHRLVESDLWGGRLDERGDYCWGFKSKACRFLFDHDLEGTWARRTARIVELAEEIGPQNSTTTTSETATTQKTQSDRVESGSSRNLYRDAPAISTLKPIVARIDEPLDIAPDAALTIGVMLGFGIGFGVKTLMEMIARLL
jgi:S-DNA-T family DNA segregation ATPase FtsK/SpoIIIE